MKQGNGCTNQHTWTQSKSTHLTVSSPAERSVCTASPPGWLQLRSTCFRREGLGLRATAEARAEQLFSVIPQPDNLQRNQDFNKLLLMLKYTSTQRKNTIYLRVCSWQCGLFTPAQRRSIPESRRSRFRLKSNSLKWEGLELRAKTRISQHLSDNQQWISLNETI